MPSKTLKKKVRSSSEWKGENTCSERDLVAIAKDLADSFAPGDRILLEGVLGAGKSTFARAALEGLCVLRPPEGSPTFAIAHEYPSPKGQVVHTDLYRLKSESEIEDAGLFDVLWNPKSIVFVEWLSNWPELEERLMRPGQDLRVWKVRLEILENAPTMRALKWELLTEKG